EDLEDAFTGTHRLLYVGIQLGEGSHRSGDKHGIQNICRQIPYGDITRKDQGRTVPDHRYHRTEKTEYDEGSKHAPVGRALDSQFYYRSQFVRISICFITLFGKCLNAADTLQCFL